MGSLGDVTPSGAPKTWLLHSRWKNPCCDQGENTAGGRLPSRAPFYNNKRDRPAWPAGTTKGSPRRQEVKGMPIYSFKCKDCGHAFDLSMSLAERESTTVKCPACGSDQIERALTGFFAKTSRKS